MSHPDDEILGCGGTVASFIKKGDEVNILILGEGITSRDENRDQKKRNIEMNSLREDIHRANEIIGTTNLFFYDFPDNRFDTVPLLDIVKTIEKIKAIIKPTIIFTHFKNDLNIDHRITYNAVITATRPISDETVKEIYCFEVLSSTEWNYPLSFSPNTFFDVSQTIEIKINALKEYKNELRDYPHPRSLKGVMLNAENWGLKVGLGYAEAFECARVIR